MRMTNLKRKFELFRGPEWKVSRHKFGSQSTISGPLTRACARGGGLSLNPTLELAILRNNLYYLLKGD